MFESLDVAALVDTYAIPWEMNILLALVVLLAGRIVVRVIVRLTEKLLARSRMDVILINFISSIVNAVLLLFVIVAALDQLGVNTTSLIALIGAAGLAIGLALQGSLQNFAAGVMLIVFRPFKAGDFVEAAGTSGIVEKIHVFSTTMRTGDNREVIVPNGRIYGGNITNYSARDTRRIDMVFGISYADDIRKAREIIQAQLANEERILPEPAPLIAVAELADSSVNLNVRPWVNAGDYWPVRFDLTEKIKLAFDDNGVTIPYPQMDVHVNNSSATDDPARG